MTKDQKAIFKKIKKEELRAEFVDMIIEQQARLGKYDGWREAYARKCRKNDAGVPFEMINAAA
jgi:hypothetical protein